MSDQQAKVAECYSRLSTLGRLFSLMKREDHPDAYDRTKEVLDAVWTEYRDKLATSDSLTALEAKELQKLEEAVDRLQNVVDRFTDLARGTS